MPVEAISLILNRVQRAVTRPATAYEAWQGLSSKRRARSQGGRYVGANPAGSLSSLRGE